MKQSGITLAVLLTLAALTISYGCAQQNMQEPMSGSMETQSKEKMDTGMETMQDNDMQKSQAETMK